MCVIFYKFIKDTCDYQVHFTVCNNYPLLSIPLLITFLTCAFFELVTAATQTSRAVSDAFRTTHTPAPHEHIYFLTYVYLSSNVRVSARTLARSRLLVSLYIYVRALRCSSLNKQIYRLLFFSFY